MATTTRRCVLTMLLLMMLGAQTTHAQLLSGLLGGGTSTSSPSTQGVIVRTTLGPLGLNVVCLLEGCTVVGNLDGNLQQVFLVRPNSGLLPSVLAATLQLVDGIVDAEVDQVLVIPSNPPAATNIPAGLSETYPVNYFTSTVWDGYANQPAAQIIRVADAQQTFNVTGSVVVADIDTGVDPNHPALKPVLLTGYDFTRNQPGGSEMNDVAPNVTGSCNGCQAAYVNQYTAAMLDQYTAAMLDGTQYSAFGHGTMVLGVVHLVAPTAHLLPLKAFQSNGSASLSNIIRAIYYAAQNGANVINMSFDMTSNSTELANALQYATGQGLICVASAGNDGEEEIVYPAALQQNVMGVASTNDFDQRSTFSNYGDQIVWVAAPGEEIISTYPFGTYSSSSGTSFSAPFVSGTAALLLTLHPNYQQSQASSAISHATWIGPNMGYGRLDVYRSLAGD
jgi:subtilisin family serine protease